MNLAPLRVQNAGMLKTLKKDYFEAELDYFSSFCIVTDEFGTTSS